MSYTAQVSASRELDSLMERFRHVQARPHFSRDEMNERQLRRADGAHSSRLLL